jgi:aspartate aminotransferase-like enzyme
MFETEELALFIPGPVGLHSTIVQAATLPGFGHRDQYGKRVLSSIYRNLALVADLPDDYSIALLNGSGTNGMEAAICSLTSSADNILCVSVGVFGDLFEQLATSHCRQTKKLSFAFGRGFDLEAIEGELQSGRYAAITMTHNESSTGVATDIAGCCELARRYGVRSIVDGVSIFGGAESQIRFGRPSCYLTATQKCLGLPAGLAIAFVANEAVEHARTLRGRGYVTDLVRHIDATREDQTLTTPNGTLLNQMRVQLERIVDFEGVEERKQRHAELRSVTRQWVRGCEDVFELFVGETDASPTVTTIRLKSGVQNPRVIAEAMRAKGYLIDTGHKKLNLLLAAAGSNPVMRVPHMGDLTVAELERFLEALKTVCWATSEKNGNKY